MDKTNFSARRRVWSAVMRCLMVLCAALTCALAAFLIIYVLVKGVPNLSWALLSTKPSYLEGTIGILPDIISTVCMVLTTLVVVLPVGVCAAVYLTEYARNRRLAAAIEYTAETLSGIPSIIYGLVGQMFFCQFLGMKKSLIAGAMTLVIMNLPTIMRTTQESLKTVPQSYREGALGLGAGKWRTIRTVVLPGCVDGVLTGCILAVGRILGETAALLYTAGFAHALYGSLGETLNNAGATLSVALYVYAKPLSVPQGVIGLFTRFGMDVTLAHPEGYDVMPEVEEVARKNCEKYGSKFHKTNDMKEAFKDADIVYPKSWASYAAMEERTKLYAAGDKEGIDALEKRLLAQNAEHKDWACTEEMMKLTKDGKALYLHCLPADITGLSCAEGEVDNSVFDRYIVPLYKQASYKPYIIAAMIFMAQVKDPVKALMELDEGKSSRKIF